MWRAGAILLTAWLGTGLAMPGHSAELIELEDECNGRQLMIQGPIEPGDFERFRNRLAGLVGGDLPAVQDPDVLWTVKLDSPGGDPAEAMRIGRLLRRAFATTEVSYRYAQRPDGVYDFQRGGELVCLNGEGRLAGCHQDIVEARCTGACLLLWLAGAGRHANEGQLGLHGLSAAEEVDGYLREMGVSDAWIERMLRPDPTGDGWLSWPERHGLAGTTDALVRLVRDCPRALDRDESYRSVTAVDPAVRDALMARAEAHRSCRRARLAEARAGVVERLAEARAGSRAMALEPRRADPAGTARSGR